MSWINSTNTATEGFHQIWSRGQSISYLYCYMPDENNALNEKTNVTYLYQINLYLALCFGDLNTLIIVNDK